MVTKQVILKDKDGNILLPETTTVAISDPQREQSLAETLNQFSNASAFGISAFNEVDPYAVGDYVEYGGNIYKFIAPHAGGAWNDAEVELASIMEIVNKYISDILEGRTIPKYAENLENWGERESLAVDETWHGITQTSGGNVSIDSAGGVVTNSIVAKSNFSALKLINTGFNLLRNAASVGTGYYVVVPALEWGAFGTAVKPNGILFTNSSHENLSPTVYFKPLADGVPESVTDGTQITPVVSNGYSFYCTSEAGYIIVSGITLASSCMHVAWSRRYDDYVSVYDANDAGSQIDITSVIAAIHNYNLMLVVGNAQDRIDRISDTQVRWTRNCDRVVPTWTNVLDSESGNYTHTAVIGNMKPDSIVICGDNDINLSVNGNTVMYIDANATGTSAYVYYQLNTPVTGTANLTMDGAIEDWGLSYLADATGDAYVNMQYAQGYPDGVAQLLATMNMVTIPVISDAFACLARRIASIEEMLKTRTGYNISVANMDADDYTSMGYPVIYYTDGTAGNSGAPSATIIPENWNAETMGVWGGFPQFIGQRYIDVYAKKVYEAVALTGSTSNWVALN